MNRVSQERCFLPKQEKEMGLPISSRVLERNKPLFLGFDEVGDDFDQCMNLFACHDRFIGSDDVIL